LMTERAEQLYTLKEARDLLKIGYDRLHILIANGELDAFSLDEEDPFSKRAWRISASSLNQFLNTRKINGVSYEQDDSKRYRA
jgi:hypothetical protein